MAMRKQNLLFSFFLICFGTNLIGQEAEPSSPKAAELLAALNGPERDRSTAALAKLDPAEVIAALPEVIASTSPTQGFCALHYVRAAKLKPGSKDKAVSESALKSLTKIATDANVTPETRVVAILGLPLLGAEVSNDVIKVVAELTGFEHHDAVALAASMTLAAFGKSAVPEITKHIKESDSATTLLSIASLGIMKQAGASATGALSQLVGKDPEKHRGFLVYRAALLATKAVGKSGALADAIKDREKFETKHRRGGLAPGSNSDIALVFLLTNTGYAGKYPNRTPVLPKPMVLPNGEAPSSPAEIAHVLCTDVYERIQRLHADLSKAGDPSFGDWKSALTDAGSNLLMIRELSGKKP